MFWEPTSNPTNDPPLGFAAADERTEARFGALGAFGGFDALGAFAPPPILT
jgi:hypothetical protein